MTAETEPALPDQDERDRVARSLDETVFAVAGAGSGKTKHLVDRVVNLLVTQRATVEHLAVITFTEAAAAELRDRVAEALEQVARGEAPAPPWDGQPGREGAAAAALAALDGLDAAAITTLHGFARRILVDHAVDAGVPPTFEVMDDARALAELRERWPAVLDDLLADAHVARAVQRVLVAGAPLGALRTVVRRLAEHWDRLAQGALADPSSVDMPAVEAGSVLEPLHRAVALAGACTSEDDSLLVHLGRMAELTEQLEARSGDELELLRLLAAPNQPLAAGRKGRAPAWSGRKNEVLGLLQEAHSAREELLDAGVGAALRIVTAALAQRAMAEARRRQSEGRLQYHDLLALACETVRCRPAVRAALHHRYRYLLVDEFQDTDPLQAELVAMIAAEPGADVAGTEWWRLPVVAGSLFFVGDPLQSIYSFRGADIATFSRTWRSLDASTASLVANFRSVPGIVHWVNAVFGSLVGDGVEDLQPAFRPAVASRPSGAFERPVTVVGAGEPHHEKSPEARRREAAEVAGVLRRAVDEGWTVGPDGHPASLSDIAVLVATRAAVPALEQALDAAGLEYRLESSSLLYGAPEVEDLFSVLRAVDDPSDAVAVVAALRTPGFGCGDDDLLRFRRAGGAWDYRLDTPAGVAPGDAVRRSMAALRALHEARSWTAVSELVWRVVSERRQLEAALDGPRWREEWWRLRYVADQARQFCERSAGGLRHYLSWVEAQREEDARVTETVLPEVDAPALAVMTAHAAKGLEFPIVAVVGFGSAGRSPSGPDVLFGPDGPELALAKRVRTPGYELSRRTATAVQQHEQLRLLYVAVTRARDHLVVSVHRAAKAHGTPAGVLEDALASADGLWKGPEARTPSAPVGPEPVQGTLFMLAAIDDGVDRSDDVDRWVSERAARLARRPQVVAATGVSGWAAAAAEVSDAAAAEEGVDAEGPVDAGSPRAPWRRGRGGTAVGRAVHAVLQTVDLASGDQLDGLARIYAGLEGVPGRAGEIRDLAEAALASDVVRAAAGARYWRELYVGAPIGGHVLEGFVDLLFEGPEGLEVVDYKTDAVADDAEVDRLAARYRLQAAAYARAVEATTGRRVRACTLLFLRGGVAIERSIGTLDAATAQVEALLSAGPTGVATPA